MCHVGDGMVDNFRFDPYARSKQNIVSKIDCFPMILSATIYVVVRNLISCSTLQLFSCCLDKLNVFGILWLYKLKELHYKSYFLQTHFITTTKYFLVPHRRVSSSLWKRVHIPTVLFSDKSPTMRSRISEKI